MNFKKLDYLDLETNHHRKQKLKLTERIKISCNIGHLENQLSCIIIQFRRYGNW